MKRFWNRLANWMILRERRMIEEFDHYYPDRCFICSVYRYARTHQDDRSEPPKHECREVKK